MKISYKIKKNKKVKTHNMEQINQMIRQIEVSVEHIQETQYELVTTTNAVRTDLD